MKVLKLIFLIIGMLELLGGDFVLADVHLQAEIDATPEGGVLQLRKGTYDDPIVLSKAIQIKADKGVIFQSCSKEAMFTITGENVHIQGIEIVSCEEDTSPYGIYMSGKNHILEDIKIKSANTGVKLDKVESSIVRNISITGSKLANGIDLWESNQNTFEGNTLNHVQDGFYLENSHQNKFLDNTIRNSRYGLHVMFSDYISIKNNHSTRNYAGAMIMGTNHTEVTENELTENNLNVNAQGLFLYDVHESTITNNVLTNNRVGLYIEASTNNQIHSNTISANFIGTQLKRIKNNSMEDNSFMRNVNELHAVDSTANTIRSNFWDAAWKLDIDGDGKSNIPFQADPYFLQLTKEVPAYQLFFQHPGMLLLQKMLKSPEHLVVTDDSPLMKIPLNQNIQGEKNRALSWLMSLVMIFSSLIIIFIGRKTK